MSSFIEEVFQAMGSFPEGKSFQKVQEKFSPEAFGNACVVFEDKALRFRFVKDRGQVMLDVANAKDKEWWPLSFICELLHRNAPGLDLASNLEALKILFPFVQEAFSDSNFASTRLQLKEIGRRRQKSIFNLLLKS